MVDKAGSARVRVEGTSPHALTLIIATDFHEQFNPLTNETTAIPNRADTTLITLPYDRTVDLKNFGSVYVELRNYKVPVASVRMRVDLDNGEEYDQEATLSDNAALIYYYLFSDFSIR
ncbi:MAG: hypothetical protein Q8N53_17210 [Longimicrobiales bacterium]|nr:hypothetical protein [Longimicrobiales bacterium]